MAQYEGGYPTYEAKPPGRGRWPLASVFFIDFVVTMIGVIIVTSLIAAGFLIANGIRQGGQFFSGGVMSPEDASRLIGVPGIFTTLVVQNLVFIAVPLLRVGVLRQEPISTIGFHAPHPLKLVAFGIGLGVVTLISNGIFGAIFSAFGVQQNQAAQYPLYAGDYVGQALFFLGAAIIVPFGEETLFRGYAFNAFKQSWSRFAWGRPAAYIISALLFMLAHSLSATEGIIGLLVPAFVMGLLFAWAMDRTGSLIPSILAHAINNGVALLLLTYCINNPGSSACSL
jgi:membrane protease YdiL (CAAX protease family)